MKVLKSLLTVPAVMIGLVVPILTWPLLMKLLGYPPSHYFIQAASLWLGVYTAAFVLLSDALGGPWRRGGLLVGILVVVIYDTEHSQYIWRGVCALL